MSAENVVKKQSSVFFKRKRNVAIVFSVCLLLYLVTASAVNFDFGGAVLSVPAAFAWLGNNIIPNESSMEQFPNIIDRLIETALLSVAVTVFAAVAAFFSSLIGTKTLKFNFLLAKCVRMIAAVFRSIPEVAWAILLLFSFGQNIMTGFFALFFTTYGMLTRAFIEAIDEVSADCVEALEATGSTTLQLVFQGIWPSSITLIITWVLYMIETNIRAATLIGLLTGTGIGALFHMFYSRMNFNAAMLVIASTAVLVVIIETIANQIRKVILK
jgi:phosphonate transport system permease protein